VNTSPVNGQHVYSNENENQYNFLDSVTAITGVGNTVCTSREWEGSCNDNLSGVLLITLFLKIKITILGRVFLRYIPEFSDELRDSYHKDS
jgi:hypothetical protein